MHAPISYTRSDDRVRTGPEGRPFQLQGGKANDAAAAPAAWHAMDREAAFRALQTGATIIMAIAVMASIVGFVQEYRSEKAMEALRRMVAATCWAVRGGQERMIDVKELVPGDVISVAAGDRVPADASFLSRSTVRQTRLR